MFTKSDIEKYFVAEKNAALFIVILGLCAVITAVIFLLVTKLNWQKGAAIPLLVFALLQIGVGYTVYKRSDADRITNVYNYDANPSVFKNKELPRMEKVQSSFKTILIVEFVLLVAAIGLILYFKSKLGQQFWMGLGIGLAAQTILLFIFDWIGYERAHSYTEGIKSFLQKMNF